MEALTFMRRATGLNFTDAVSCATAAGGQAEGGEGPNVRTFTFSDGSKAVVKDGEHVSIDVFGEDGVPVREMRLFADASGRLVETLWTSTRDTVEFSAQGGGFVHKMARAEFENNFMPAALPGFALKAVSADWLPEGLKVPAYTNGQRWNGWAMPYFTLAAAQSLQPHMPDLRYDNERDAFVSKAYDDDVEEEVFASETLVIDEHAIKVYAVGAGSWCWWLED